jgi:hypothetical protein
LAGLAKRLAAMVKIGGNGKGAHWTTQTESCRRIRRKMSVACLRKNPNNQNSAYTSNKMNKLRAPIPNIEITLLTAIP